MAKLKVRAKAGLKIYFPTRIKAAPGARSFVLEGDAVIEVDDVRFVRRRLKVGDLELVRDTPVKRTRKPKPTPKPITESEG